MRIGLLRSDPALFTGRTLKVDPAGGGDFTRLYDALIASRPRDRIVLAPGEYVLDMTLSGSAMIVGPPRGEAPAILRSSHSLLPVFTIQDGSYWFERLTFRGAGPAVSAIRSEIVARDVVFEGEGNALFGDEAHVYLLDNQFRANAQVAVLMSGGVLSAEGNTFTGGPSIAFVSGQDRFFGVLRRNAFTTSQPYAAVVGLYGKAIFEANVVEVGPAPRPDSPPPFIMGDPTARLVLRGNRITLPAARAGRPMVGCERGFSAPCNGGEETGNEYVRR